MVDEVINADSIPESEAAPVEGTNGIPATDGGEQPAPSEESRSKEELLAELETTKKSAEEYRSMSDRQRNEQAAKISELDGKIAQVLDSKTIQDKASKDSQYADTIEKLRVVYKEDPLKAMMLLMQADKLSRDNSAPAPDPTINQLKTEKLVSTGLSKLGIDVPQDAIYEIIGELGMNAGNALAIKTAVEIYKGRNIDALATGGTPTKTKDTSISHNVAVETPRAEVINLTDTEKRHVNVAVDRKVFSSLKEFNDYDKEFGSLQRGEKGGYIIEDKDYKEAK